MTHRRSPSDSGSLRERALRLIDAYGADRSLWPEEDRPLYDRLVEDARLWEARERALRLDQALARAPEVKCADGLKGRIMADYGKSAAARRSAPSRPWWSRGVGRLAPAGALAGLSALGFLAGAASAETSDAETLYYAEAAAAATIDEGAGPWPEF